MRSVNRIKFIGLVLIFLVMAAAYLSAKEIAVVSAAGGNAKVFRGATVTSLEPGLLLLDQDEIQTGDQSWCAVVWLDASAKLRLFENTRVRLLGGPPNKTTQNSLSLAWGSIHVRLAPSSQLRCLAKNTVITGKDAAFVLKASEQADSKLIVLDGELQITDSGNSQTGGLEKGMTAFIDHNGYFTPRPSISGDLDKVELEYLEPSRIVISNNVLVPMRGPDGAVHYIEFSW